MSFFIGLFGVLFVDFQAVITGGFFQGYSLIVLVVITLQVGHHTHTHTHHTHIHIHIPRQIHINYMLYLTHVRNRIITPLAGLFIASTHWTPSFLADVLACEANVVKKKPLVTVAWDRAGWLLVAK